MPKKIGKKELKQFINANGFFYSMALEVKKNAPAEYASRIPEGATYFEGVVSNGELNRNGYIIRPNALIESLNTYMLNPVILLQHDTDEPIGHCLSAEVRGSGNTQEVFVRGYVYDDLTGGRFGRNLFRGLSTGHIPHEVEFENAETGEVISAEEFRKFNWEEQFSGDWIMAVTKLDWVEFSLVGIGSVKRALVTSKNCIEAYLSEQKFCENTVRALIGNTSADSEDEQPAEDTPAKEDGQDQNGSEQPEKVEGSENAGETPAASTDEPAEKSGEGEDEPAPEKVDGNKIRISKADRERLLNAAEVLAKTLEATIADEEGKEEDKADEPETPAAGEGEQKAEEQPAGEDPVEEPKAEDGAEIQNAEENSAQLQVAPEIKNALQALVDLNFSLEKENAELRAKLNKIPNKRGLSITSQFNNKPEPKKASAAEAMVQLLRDAGFAV